MREREKIKTSKNGWKCPDIPTDAQNVGNRVRNRFQRFVAINGVLHFRIGKLLAKL